MFTPDNLPNLLKEFEELKSALLKSNPSSIWPHIDKCQNAVQEAHDSLTPSKQKDMLGQMLAQMGQGRKEIETATPKLLEQMHKESQGSLGWIKEFAAELEQTEKDFQDKLKAEEELAASLQAPPAAPEVPLDPSHGAGLALEFLQALGLLETAKKMRQRVDEGSIAAHWHEPDEGGTPPTAPPPTAPPTTPAKVLKKVTKKRPSKDAWEGLSQAEE